MGDLSVVDLVAHACAIWVLSLQIVALVLHVCRPDIAEVHLGELSLVSAVFGILPLLIISIYILR